MAEEIGFENGRNSNFQGLVTLTLDPAIRHTVVHHSSTSTYIPNFIQIEETFCGRTDVRTDGHFPPILLGRLLKVDLKRKHTASTRNVESSLCMRHEKFRWQKLFLPAKTIFARTVISMENQFFHPKLANPVITNILYCTTTITLFNGHFPGQT